VDSVIVMADVWIKEHPDGSWWASGDRAGEIMDGWEGIAAFVEAGLTVHWESPEATEAFTVACGDPSEI
jgi:hypothetical protein